MMMMIKNNEDCLEQSTHTHTHTHSQKHGAKLEEKYFAFHGRRARLLTERP